MPEDNKSKEGAEGFADAEKHNAEISSKLAAQDISGKSMAPSENLDASNALDELAKKAEEDAKKKADASAVVENTAPAKTDAEIKAETEAKAAADKAAADAEADRKRADEFFKDSPSLPAGASPKSSESFSAIKIKAAKEIAAREAELEKLKKENADLAEKAKNVVPPETLKELEDHRQWRAKLDIEADPKFKSFDKTISETHEFIYAQLKRSPAVTSEVIEKIKSLGGPEFVQMDKIFEAIKDPAMQRLIEAKLADVEMAKFNKSQAIEAAKKNVSEYLSAREKQAVEAVTSHNQNTAAHLTELTKSLSWFNDKQIDPKASDKEAAKKEVDAHNAFVAETKKQIDAALKDDSPEMRAIMLAGMAQLFYLQKVHDGTNAKLASVEKSLAEVTEKYDKLRQGSTTRLRETAELRGGQPVTKKDSDQFTKTAAESLDDLRKQVTEERERAAAAGGR